MDAEPRGPGQLHRVALMVTGHSIRNGGKPERRQTGDPNLPGQGEYEPGGCDAYDAINADETGIEGCYQTLTTYQH